MNRSQSVGLWTGLAILAAVAVLAYRSIDATGEMLGWVEHTHEVLEQLADVSSTYSRAAAARRAYVVAGDESQLDDRTKLDERTLSSTAALRKLLADNPDQVHRVDSMALLQHERLVDLDAAAQRRRADGAGLETAQDLALVTALRNVREAIASEENRLMAERYALTRRDVGRTKLAEVVGTAASFALLLVAFGRLRQEVQRRRTSEQGARRINRFLDSIVENIPDMIFVKEAGHLRFERINRAGEELLGVARQDFIGCSDADFFPADQAEAFQARDRDTLAGRVVVDIPEEPIQTKTGERWLHTKKVPIVDEEGHPLYLLGISEDITDRRKAAEALKSAKEAAEAANQELEAFSYAVAHDLRAPLRAIDGFSLALEEDCQGRLDPTCLQHLGRVRAAAQQMSQTIDALLGLSRVARSDLAREDVDLSKIAGESIGRLREGDPGREVGVIIQEGLVVKGDGRLLRAALDNLLANAWKFTGTRPDAQVELGASLQDGERVFFVRDNGAGFDPRYGHKLFGAFQRLHSPSEFEGTGIGLATVHRIVRRHGGRIWAEAQVNQGATFYFTLGRMG